MRKRVWAVFLLCCSLWAGDRQPAKLKDQCAPEPGSTAPTLPAKILTGQGTVHFPITTKNQEAQRFFDQGVAQMHSFWAREAERSFLQAAELDPEAPMPWWGVAMVAAGDFRPGFQLGIVNGAAQGKTNKKRKTEKLEGGPLRALKATERALALSESPGKITETERAYIKAVAARRNRQSADPNGDYTAVLRALVSEHPQEVEAKLYLALQTMSGFTVPEKTPKAGSMEAVALLKELIAAAPEHPGVHHYVIHGWEGSSFAKEAWPSCEKYPLLVSNIPHALHMPGHIWAQTGRWREAEEAFASAAENERGYMSHDVLYGSGHHGHNVHFLIATYAFEQNYGKAVDAAHELIALPLTPRQRKEVDDWYAAPRQGWFGLMRTLVYCEKWDEILDGKTLPEQQTPREKAWYHWARAIAYSERGDIKSTEAEAKQMDRAMKELAKKTKAKQAPAVLAVGREELNGHIALAEKRDIEALELFEKASVNERKIPYSEPPPYPRPIAEIAGKLALQLGQRDRAARNFQVALKQYPNSPRAELGLRRALQKTEAVTADLR